MKISLIIAVISAFLGLIASLVGVVLAARDGHILSLICFCITAITCFIYFGNALEDLEDIIK